ncbi:MAG: amino acid--tRNA ligase-related protein, partial [Candidatus Micrarchaeia archaeon]
LLNSEGFKIEYGASLGNDEEIFLGEKFKSPLWIKYLPRSVEPFPYRINQKDPRSTLTADMLIPGYGEILGVAEKIYDINELRKRQKEDFVPNDPEVYKWYNQLREYGLPPHSGFGMGIERAIRVLLQLNHVKDIVPYPRLYSHLPYP